MNLTVLENIQKNQREIKFGKTVLKKGSISSRLGAPGFRIGYQVSKTITSTNPLKYITRSKPCFLLRTKIPQYYLKFGALLEFMQRAIIPYTKTGKEFTTFIYNRFLQIIKKCIIYLIKFL